MTDISGMIEMTAQERVGVTSRGPGMREYYSIERDGKLIQGQPFSYTPKDQPHEYWFQPDDFICSIDDYMAARERLAAAP